MHVLITGGAGFIGSQLTDHFLKKKYRVSIIDNLSWGKKEFFSHNVQNPRFTFIQLDLLDKKKLQTLFPKEVDTVFHLAANSDIRRGVDNPETDFLNTTTATFNLLETMRKNSVKKIFYTSGSGVYGNLGLKYIGETYGPLQPVSMYGATKLSAEAMIAAFVNLFGFQAWILRPANIIGPRATHGVIHDFIKSLKKSPKELTILGDGEQSKSYLYIEDVIAAIDLVWKRATDRINLYNISSNSFITVTEIANIILKEMKLQNTKVIYTGGKVGWIGDVPIVRINSSTIKKLGWISHYTSRQAVIKTVQVLLKSTSK